MTEDDYQSFDSNNVTDHLYNAQDLFFSDKKNVYKYALQKRHYNTAIEKRATYNAAHLFKIIKGTNLVKKKKKNKSLQQKQKKGLRYHIYNNYIQHIERHLCTQR